MAGALARLVGLAAIAGMGWLVSQGMVGCATVETLTPRTAAASAAAPQPVAAPPQTPAAPTPPPATAWREAFGPRLALCPQMAVSNAPAADAERFVVNYAPIVLVNGVALAVNPAEGACLSSGFGPRNGRPHKGLDYHARTGVPIRAAADGVVIERQYRDDFGNMLLIDHGGGVHTRYAHLASFADGTAVGDTVAGGVVIGQMGQTAGYAVPIHLHYEVLIGDYANPRASFGLEARSPFDFPPP
ncbi:MAG: peptidoglycan DD-metalloendopeptidase family protein [Alphaproteobacteria bacterium]|nr:peptidoglycan DD-metalloendopeptidase family protein [Alphaproteobacteria bacterium]